MNLTKLTTKRFVIRKSLIGKNVEITSKELNIIEFEITGPDFEMKLSGFNPNQRLRSKTILND